MYFPMEDLYYRDFILRNRWLSILMMRFLNFNGRIFYITNCQTNKSHYLNLTYHLYEWKFMSSPLTERNLTAYFELFYLMTQCHDFDLWTTSIWKVSLDFIVIINMRSAGLRKKFHLILTAAICFDIIKTFQHIQTISIIF